MGLKNEGIIELEVCIGGQDLLSPSIAFAHARMAARRAIACLPLSSAGRRGQVDVEVNGRVLPIHFVTDEGEHRNFFRDVIEIEEADEDSFSRLAPSAFPDLAWADTIWGGLSQFSMPFRDLRNAVTLHLAVLDDHGAALFRDLQRTRPQEISPRLGSHGAPATDENGRTKANSRARRERTCLYDGHERTFWWHTKLQPDVNRIHFLFDSNAERIVVGIFARHCYVPD